MGKLHQLANSDPRNRIGDKNLGSISLQMAEFKSRMCDVCSNALRLAFASLKDRTPEISDDVAHHATKDSLVDSVLRQSCHLCRLFLYHLKVHWVKDYTLGPEEEQSTPTSLSEDDFKESDFEFGTFPSDRVGIRSYMLGLPEDVGLRLQIEEFSDGVDGVLATMKLDCDALAHVSVTARFWVLAAQGMKVPMISSYVDSDMILVAFGGFANTKRFNDNSAASSCQKMVGKWLEECENDHDICKVQRNFLPTRLLDLREVDKRQRLRLVDSRNCDPTARYVTLSHCWGLHVPVTLTKETEKEMRDGFALDKMPPTFRDAIQVAGWAKGELHFLPSFQHINPLLTPPALLKVRYIWIDSCCIIQGSKSDWETEAKMMEHVYKNTFFNISADHSESSLGGCFSDRLAYKTTPVQYAVEGLGQLFFLSRNTFMRSLIESPIAARAWVVQERFLSPRILHFTADQIFWECAATCICETFPKGLPWVYDHTSSWQYRSSMVIMPPLHRIRPDYYKVWGSICQDYSRTRLTYLSDKLIAFSGVARDFQSRLPDDTYLAGMWKSKLYSSLLWSVMALDGRPVQPNGSRVEFADPYITASSTGTYRAPSWSWLGKDCAIFWERNAHSTRPLMDILDVSVDLVKDDEPTGDMKRGSLTVRGMLRAASWNQREAIDSIVLDGKHGDGLLQQSTDPQSPGSTTFSLQRDTGDEFPVKNIFLLPVRRGTALRPVELKKDVVQGLVLCPTDNDGVYQRMGYFEVRGLEYFGALQYELLPPAQEMDRPWEKLGSLCLDARSDNESSYVAKDDNTMPLIVSMENDEYDRALFKKVEWRTITIV